MLSSIHRSYTNYEAIIFEYVWGGKVFTSKYYYFLIIFFFSSRTKYSNI